MNRLHIESELHERARELAESLSLLGHMVLGPLMGSPIHEWTLQNAAHAITTRLYEDVEWTRGEFAATVTQDERDPKRVMVGVKPLTLWATQVWARVMDPNWQARSPGQPETENPGPDNALWRPSLAARGLCEWPASPVDPLAEIERVWSAASPGPWRTEHAHPGLAHTSHQYGGVYSPRGYGHAVVEGGDGWIEMGAEDAAAIAAAPEHIRWLVAEVKRLRGGS